MTTTKLTTGISISAPDPLRGIMERWLQRKLNTINAVPAGINTKSHTKGRNTVPANVPITGTDPYQLPMSKRSSTALLDYGMLTGEDSFTVFPVGNIPIIMMPDTTSLLDVAKPYDLTKEMSMANAKAVTNGGMVMVQDMRLGWLENMALKLSLSLIKIAEKILKLLNRTLEKSTTNTTRR